MSVCFHVAATQSGVFDRSTRHPPPPELATCFPVSCAWWVASHPRLCFFASYFDLTAGYHPPHIQGNVCLDVKGVCSPPPPQQSFKCYLIYFCVCVCATAPCACSCSAVRKMERRVENYNWAGAESGCRVLDANGAVHASQKILCEGLDGVHEGSERVTTLCLPERPPEVTLRYIGWSSGSSLGSNPFVVVISSGETSTTFTRWIKAEAKRGMGLLMWFVPGGIPSTHRYLRFTVEATFDSSPSAPVTFTSFYALENAPIMPTGNVSSPTMPSVVRPASAASSALVQPGQLQDTYHRASDYSGARAERGRQGPFTSALHGLEEEIHRLKGVRSPQPVGSPTPPSVGVLAGTAELQAGLDDVRQEVGYMREGVGGVSGHLEAALLQRMEDAERAIESLERRIHAERPDAAVEEKKMFDRLYAALERRMLSALEEKVGASVDSLAASLVRTTQRTLSDAASPAVPTPAIPASVHLEVGHRQKSASILETTERVSSDLESILDHHKREHFQQVLQTVGDLALLAPPHAPASVNITRHQHSLTAGAGSRPSPSSHLVNTPAPRMSPIRCRL